MPFNAKVFNTVNSPWLLNIAIHKNVHVNSIMEKFKNAYKVGVYITKGNTYTRDI